jgi:phosphate starvation-inducible PhoH-like protein
VVRGDEALLSGDPERVEKIERLFTEMLSVLGRTGSLDVDDVRTLVAVVQAGGASSEGPKTGAVYYGKHGLVRPKTQGQAAYVDAVSRNDIVFVIGPAGTGKTYLAVALALARLKEKEVSRIILTRPAIEAGESLGFLPGDLMEKVDPYLRPLTDAIFDMLPADQLQRNLEKKIIEIVPLAYMRGRTLNNAFVILDEAQNATAVQMKMFLTRLGIQSKAVITGDVTQIDLPESAASGLIQIQDVLKEIEGIEFTYLGKQDVVRHRLVKEIIQAYEEFQNTTTVEA